MTDVVVVGAGFAGLACARFLVDEGASVVVIDDGGAASSSRAGVGGAWLTHGEHPWRLVASLGVDRAAALFQFGREGLDLAEKWLPFDRCGGLWIAGDAREEGEIARSIDALRACGVPVEAVPGGMRLPDEGIVDPIAGLASLGAGLDVRRGRVIGVDSDIQGIIVGTDAGDVRSEVVVLAAGAGVRGIDAVFVETVWSYRDQVRVCGDVDVAPLVRTGAGWMAWVRRGGQLALTGARWATPHLEEGEYQPIVVDAVQDKLDAFARSRGGPFAEAPIIGRRAVLQAKSCDGLPLIGPLPGRPRVIACAAFHGNPVGWGLRAARAVADGLSRGAADGLPTFLAMTRMG